MSDVTNSIQVQRGLGASNFAIASVGGTINVLTSATDMKKGGTFKQEFGSQSFLKTTLSYSTGKLNNDIATSFLLQKKTGNGYVDGTWTDAYSYFFTANKTFGNHSFDFHFLERLSSMGNATEIINTLPRTGNLLITILDTVAQTTAKLIAVPQEVVGDM